MKKLFFSLLLFYNFQVLFSQNNPFVCGTVFTEQMRNYEVNKAIAKRALATTPPVDLLTPYVFNIKFWQINDANGNNIINHNFTVDDEIMDYIKTLNTAFNQYNIFFKYKDFQILNDDITNSMNNPMQFDSFYLSNNDMHNTINILFGNSWQDNVPFRPFTILDLQSIYIGMEDIVSTEQNKSKLILCHEMGHLLGLWHTDGSYSYYEGEYQCEHVTRIPLTVDPLSDYNADLHGDYVEDTLAEPETMFWATDFVNCNYINSQNQMDCNTPPQLYENIIPYNFMQVGDFLNVPSLDCANFNFTAGQIKKMRETILTSSLFYLNNPLSNSITDVASLFQPYEQTMIAGNVIVTTTDNGNGTAYVCRNRLVQQKFQKGFDYIFPDNQTPDPANASVDTLPITIMNTANYPVTIQQLATGQTNLLTNTGEAKLNCTRGVICTDETFFHGTIFSTQNLLDMNVTIEELNALQVKDPELYNNLLEHYYYKLTKETATGAKVEQVFYKQ